MTGNGFKEVTDQGSLKATSASGNGRLLKAGHATRRASRVARRAALAAIVLAASSALPACVYTPAREAGSVHTYQLSLADGANTTEAKPKKPTAVLLVNLPQAQAGFDSSRIIYLMRPNEVSYFATSQWADAPPQMLAPLIVQALDRTGVWKAVVQMPTTVRGDYRLDTEHLALQQEFFRQPSRVRLSLRAQLIELREHRVIGTREFESVEEASSDDAYGGVMAANRAATRLLDHLAAWLAGCVSDRAVSGC